MSISINLYLLVCFFFKLLVSIQGAQDELDAVVVIFRHGDRTPIDPYPNDPYRNGSFWPVDFGQLTNIGKRQQLDLGRWMRARYQTFLPSTYSEKDIWVRSTDVDRTLMSAEAHLAGLYPPQGNQVWDRDIDWQPIPIHTTPEKEDALLAGKKFCPKYNSLKSRLLKSPYFRNVSHQNHDLYAYLTRYSGKLISTLESLEYLYNNLLIETYYNYTLPDWAKKVFPNKMQAGAFLSFAVQTYTPEMARLKTGPLFAHIIDFFQNHTTTPSTGKTPKFLIFSGHDTTIANVLNTMGAFEYHSPPYASTIIFELRKRNNGRNYINIYYKNGTTPSRINLRNCDFDCDLMDFINILKPTTLSLEEWELECQSHWSSSDWPLNLEGDVILGCVLLGIALLSTAILMGLKRTKREHETNYIQLPDEEYA